MGSLTFLVLQPELLLDLLAGEVDAAAQLGAVQSLRHVVAPVLLEEGQQLLPRALRRQGLQHLGEAWRVRGEAGGQCGTRAGRSINVRLMQIKDNVKFKRCPSRPRQLVDGSKSSVMTVLGIDESSITPLRFCSLGGGL